MVPLKELHKFFPGKPTHLGAIKLKYKKRIDKLLVKKLTKFIRYSSAALSKLGLDGLVVGLSGGIDSSVICALSKIAVGKKVLAIIVDFGNKQDTDFSIGVAEQIGISYAVVNGKELFNQQLKLMPAKNIMMRIHLRTRIVNNIIFQVADNESAAVVDTTDKSEYLTGRHAECFYGHFAPLIDLYKSELYDLAKVLNMPDAVLRRPAGCQEFLDSDAFGADWTTLDKLLFLITEKKFSLEKISRIYKIGRAWLARFKRRIDLQRIRTETKKLFLY